MSNTAKQLARYFVSTDLENLLSHYKDYRSEYEVISSRLMENQPTHDFFINWLGSKGMDKEQFLLTYLEEQGVQIVDQSRSAFVTPSKEKYYGVE